MSLPKDATDEAIIESIANAMSIPKEEVPSFNKNEALTAINAEHEEIELLKSSYKSLLDFTPKVQLSKYEELNDIGRFIYAANHTPPHTFRFVLNVPETLESFPDFTLLLNDKRIGLEHTRLMNRSLKATNVAIVHCLERAEQILLKEFSHLSKTVNVFFDYNKNIDGIGNFYSIKFSSSEKRRIASILADYIKSILNGILEVKPDFISKIDIISNNELKLDINLGDSYVTSYDFADILTKRINKKEERASAYREAVDIDFLWLIIVIDDLNRYSGFNLEGPFFPNISTSNFDCIIIFEKFGMEILVLYTKHN